MKSPHLKGLLATSAVATALMDPTNASAAIDMFLKIDNVQGESQDAKHRGDIDVISWSWGETKATAQRRDGRDGHDGRDGRDVPLSCITDLTVTKYVDLATPQLITSGVTNEVFSNAYLTVRRPGKDVAEFFKVHMTNVTISSYQTGAMAGDDRLTETITLHFNAASGQYIPQKADGSAGDPVTWEVAENGGRGNGKCP
jgi:type VI secretion system secreted protein Hcp